MADPVVVRTEVAAPAEALWALVADLPRMGRWSPECRRCTWLGGATGAEVGARFRGWNRLGWRRWWTTGTVVVAEPGRELSFDVDVGPLAVARWTYRFEPLDGGRCVLAEEFADRRGRLVTAIGRVLTGVDDRAAHNAEGMRATLARIRAAAESGEGAAPA